MPFEMPWTGQDLCAGLADTSQDLWKTLNHLQWKTAGRNPPANAHHLKYAPPEMRVRHIQLGNWLISLESGVWPRAGSRPGGHEVQQRTVKNRFFLLILNRFWMDLVWRIKVIMQKKSQHSWRVLVLYGFECCSSEKEHGPGVPVRWRKHISTWRVITLVKWWPQPPETSQSEIQWIGGTA